jgi:hypothetical protein
MAGQQRQLLFRRSIAKFRQDVRSNLSVPKLPRRELGIIE